MFTYIETLGYGCKSFTKKDQDGRVTDGIMHNGYIILAYDNQNRTLRVDYRAFSGQKMRAFKKFLGEEMYNFLKKNKGKNTTYGERDNDDTPEKHIARFIQYP